VTKIRYKGAMQRSVTRLAGLCLLLQLGCGDGPPAKSPAPNPRPPKPARSSHVSLSHAQPAASHGGHSSSSSQASEDVETLPSSEQLAERFGSSRALSVQSGSASYYSDSLAGRPTASGIPYEPQAFTAAHRKLPFGSVLRVKRKNGGQVVYVRVNDRGPYGGRGRILDLSRAAAEQLGMLRAGVVEVRLEVVEYGHVGSKGR
jgi:rare lipoprotein A